MSERASRVARYTVGGIILGTDAVLELWEYYGHADLLSSASHGYLSGPAPHLFLIIVGLGVILATIHRIAESAPVPDPDVFMEWTFPGPMFLRASGNVSEIDVGPIVIAEGIIGTDTRGGQAINIVSQCHSMEFQTTSDIHDGESRILLPRVFVGTGYSRSVTQNPVEDSFRAAVSRRRGDVGEPPAATDAAQLDTYAEKIRRPIEIPFEIRFWNRGHTQQWSRRETLVYDPSRHSAFVRHEGVPSEVTPSAVHKSEPETR